MGQVAGTGTTFVTNDERRTMSVTGMRHTTTLMCYNLCVLGDRCGEVWTTYGSS
jgi:hypothetical protein